MAYPRLTGFMIFCAVLALDQWSKTAILSSMLPQEICSFFNLVLVHNRGISFGLFSQMQSMMPLILTILTSMVALALAFWFTRARDIATACALGFIIGGAIGNIIDRIRFGSVTDFLDFHLGTHHWPAFNIADSAIFIGVVILALISIVKSPEKDTI